MTEIATFLTSASTGLGLSGQVGADRPQVQVRRTDTGAITHTFAATPLPEVGSPTGEGGYSVVITLPDFTVNYTYVVRLDPNATGLVAGPLEERGEISGPAEAALLTDVPAILLDTSVMEPRIDLTLSTGVRDSIKGGDNRDLTNIAGAGWVAADNLVQAHNKLDLLQIDIDNFENITRFKVSIPPLERPEAGTTLHEITFNLKDDQGLPVDADGGGGGTVTVEATSFGGIAGDRDGRLGSVTMTNISTGRYEVTFSVANTDILEGIRFFFTWAEGGNANNVDKSSHVQDGNAVGYLASDRTRDDQIAVETASLDGTKITTARADNLDDLDAPITGIPAAVATFLETTGPNPHGTGSWTSSWAAAELEQIRDALGVDGTKTLAVGGQLQHIDQYIYFDPVDGTPGGSGSSDDPISTETALRTRADSFGLQGRRRIRIRRGILTLSQPWENFYFEGESCDQAACFVDFNGEHVCGSTFFRLGLTGSGGPAGDLDFIRCYECDVISVSNVNGRFSNCSFFSTNSFNTGSNFHFCSGAGNSTPVFDHPVGLFSHFEHWSGPIHIGVCALGARHTIHGSSMDITLTAAMTQGTIRIVGTGTIVDNRTGGVVELDGWNGPTSAAGIVAGVPTSTTIPTTISAPDDRFENMQLSVWDGSRFVTTNVNAYANVGGTFTVSDLGFVPAVDAMIYVIARTGSVPVNPQSIRDSMKLAPTAGAPAAGSIDDDLDIMKGAGFITGDDSLEAIRDRGDAAWVTGATGLTAQQTRDSMKLTPTAGAPDAGSVDEHLDDINTETSAIDGRLPTDPADESVQLAAHATTLAGVVAVDTKAADIQGRLPATLITGRMRSHVEGIDAGVTATIAAAVRDVNLAAAAAGSLGEGIIVAKNSKLAYRIDKYVRNGTTGFADTARIRIFRDQAAAAASTAGAAAGADNELELANIAGTPHGTFVVLPIDILAGT